MFKELYKRSFELKDTQEERRQALLEKQKEERRNLQDGHRSLEEIVFCPIQDEGDSDSGKSVPNKNNSRHRSKYMQRQYQSLMRNFREAYGVDLSLQQSEWLRERPTNICDWLLVPCPKGQRSLVVAYNRQTRVYNKLKRCVNVFRSMLPGDGVNNDKLTILDCIYLREQNAFYVLDVLAFNDSLNLIYCEAEFRFFWLRSKWSEHENLETRSASNQKPFYLVKQYDFDNMSSIAEAFQRYPLWPNNKPELDGFLFYHRFANYTCGTTPLVGWLFAFMVPDVLDMQVNEQYKKPADYNDPLKYMDQFDKRLKEKLRRSQEHSARREQRNHEEMDSIDSQPRNLPLINLIDDKTNATSSNLSELACRGEGSQYFMREDAMAESDEENSLKMLLDSQRNLEMADNGKEEIIFETSNVY